MKKIPTMFVRDPKTHLVTSERTTGTHWVASRGVVARRKYDGTACLIHNDKLWKRWTVSPSANGPPLFLKADEDTATGEVYGWIPVSETAPWDVWHREALKHLQNTRSMLSRSGCVFQGTYELCGPKINRNPERCRRHRLIRHAVADRYEIVPYALDIMRVLLQEDIEGLVFTHPGGRQCKIKKRDFGLPRKPESNR